MNDNENGIELLPPGKPTKLQNPLQFFFDILYLCIVFIPILISSAVWNWFLLKPKSVCGKVVLVTGSGRGIGRGFAQKFADLGCKIACADIDEKINKETVQIINKLHPNSAVGYTCNIALSSELEKLHESIISDFGEVNVIIHSAAIISDFPVTHVNDGFLDVYLNVNLKSHLLIVREFLPEMLKRNEGHIVSIASLACFFGNSHVPLYTTCKHGIAGFMECMYHYLRKIPGNKVRVSNVCPFFVNTSETYNKIFSLRLPLLSIEETVNIAVNGILKDKRLITIPSALYYLIHILKFFPDKFMNTFQDTFRVDVNPPTMEEQSKYRLSKLLESSFNTKMCY